MYLTKVMMCMIASLRLPLLFIFISIATFRVSVHAAPPVLEASFSTGIANGWVRVERWRDPDPSFIQEIFPDDGRGDQTGQRATFFGTPQPDSGLFLLYYAPGWESNSRGTPVLLVHGAIQDAGLAWANPNERGSGGCGELICPTTGLMQALAGDGFKVFAISFAHPNGDGYFWAEQIANAITVIKQRTGASAVDVVALSKGAQNARMYVSSLRKTWGTAYRGDVRRLILMGAPNNGFDWGFRHGWNLTFSVYPECGGSLNGPAPHDWIVCFGVWWNRPQWSYESAFFPGSAQMLKRWDNVYSLPSYEQDWWTTYYGGWGFYSHSKGIDAFIGASLVDPLRQAGVPVSVETYLLCGDSPTIYGLHNEHTGPSDGIVFVDSCLDTAGIGQVGGTAVLHLHHLALGWSSIAVNQIKGWLAAP